MKLAKPCIDIGIFTNQREEQLAFWQQDINLPFSELLKTGGGSHQLRHDLNGSIFKLNHVRDELPATGSTGYTELMIAREGVSDPTSFVDPDGNKVSLVPPGYKGITNIGIELTVSSIAKFQHFYRNVLQIEQVDDCTFRWATTLFFLKEDPNYTSAAEMRGIGYRYITVQVWKVDEEHAAFIERGGTEARAPVTLGTTARISFINDPDGNWIEVSQRASLTGDL